MGPTRMETSLLTKGKEKLAGLMPASLRERWLPRIPAHSEAGALEKSWPGQQETLVLITEAALTPPCTEAYQVPLLGLSFPFH